MCLQVPTPYEVALRPLALFRETHLLPDDTLDAPGGQIVLLDRHPSKTGVQTCGCSGGEVLVDTASLIAHNYMHLLSYTS